MIPSEPTLAHRDLERHQVQLAQGAFVDDTVDRHPFELGFVAGEVLDRGGDPLGLHAADERRSKFAGEQWVLGIGLEVATGQRGAMQVDGRGKQDPTGLCTGLVAECHTEFAEQVLVPGRSERSATRDVQGTHLLARTWDLRATRTGRTVADENLGNADPRHSGARPCAGSGGQRRSFFDGHRLDQCNYVAAHPNPPVDNGVNLLGVCDAAPMEWRLAELNVARLRAALEDPAKKEFVEALDKINALAHSSPGFVWRLQTDDDNATGDHGLRRRTGDHQPVGVGVRGGPRRVRLLLGPRGVPAPQARMVRALHLLARDGVSAQAFTFPKPSPHPEAEATSPDAEATPLVDTLQTDPTSGELAVREGYVVGDRAALGRAADVVSELFDEGVPLSTLRGVIVRGYEHQLVGIDVEIERRPLRVSG